MVDYSVGYTAGLIALAIFISKLYQIASDQTRKPIFGPSRHHVTSRVLI